MDLRSTEPPDSTERGDKRTAFSVLRRFARRRTEETCDLCSADIASEHQHLLEPLGRKLHCCCDACAILFSSDAGSRYRRVPRNVEFLPDFRLSDEQWEGLHLPIDLAFFFNSSTEGRVVALYPGPAGVTESLLALESWQELTADNPILGELDADVEALLVYRVAAIREYYRVPIDHCFKLVGLIRMHWRGLSGGTEVWREMAKFFTDLKERSGSSPVAPQPDGSCGTGSP